jgi:BON domain
MSQQQYRGSAYAPEEEAGRARAGGFDEREYAARDLEGQGFGRHADEGFRGRGPRGYRRSSERIREDVCEALTDERTVDAADIEVDVADGIVTLRGIVSDRRQKRRAEDVAERAGGVRDVRNQLEISERGMVGDLTDRVGSRRGGDELGDFREPSWAAMDFRGFEVEARDGTIGTVDKRSEVGADHLIIDTGPWIFGKKVVLPVGLVERVDADGGGGRLFVSRWKDEIKNAPEFDEDAVDDPAYGAELRSYYRDSEYAGSHRPR